MPPPILQAQNQDPTIGSMPVSRPRSSFRISASNRRRWQGGPTMEYREYSEEAQRSQRRRGPARYATNFGDGTPGCRCISHSHCIPGVLRPPCSSPKRRSCSLKLIDFLTTGVRNKTIPQSLRRVYLETPPNRNIQRPLLNRHGPSQPMPTDECNAFQHYILLLGGPH